MQNRPEDQADPMAEDDEAINGPYEPIDSRPVWRRHAGKIGAAVAVVTLMSASLITTGPGAFAIDRGEGLARIGVNYQTAIDLAEHCERPIYMGQIQRAEYRITYATARLIESQTDRTQVTVGGLQVGDRFNPRRNLFGVWVKDACPVRLNDELLYN